MGELDIGTQAASTMPLWLTIILSLGGLELIKYLLGLIIGYRSDRRKENAQAKQEEATAGQQDAELRKNEVAVMNQVIDTVRLQLTEVMEAYKTIRAERDELRSDKEEDRKIKAELRYNVSELQRKVGGLEKAFTDSETRRLASERLYCSNEKCTRRKPPIGTYSSEAIARKRVPRTTKKTIEITTAVAS